VPELGLYYYRARWYDPMLGDFLERDPLGPVDSPNLYQALGRNPINITDPQGLYEKDFHFYAVYYLARAAGFAPADARLLAWSSQYVDDYEHTKPLTADFSTLGGFHFLSPARVEEGRVCIPALKPNLLTDCFAVTVVAQDPVRPGWENQIAVANLARAASIDGEKGRRLIALGIALHSWADTFAHEQRTAVLGDPVNFAVPRPVGSTLGEVVRQAATQVVGGLVPTGHSAWGNVPDWPWIDPEKAVRAARSIWWILRALPEANSAPVKEWEEIDWKVRSVFWTKAPLEKRVEAWKILIANDFEDVTYTGPSDVPAARRLDFETEAERQRYCVLKQEFGMPCNAGP
jgi:hypothetical protein